MKKKPESDQQLRDSSYVVSIETLTMMEAALQWWTASLGSSIFQSNLTWNMNGVSLVWVQLNTILWLFSQLHQDGKLGYFSSSIVSWQSLKCVKNYKVFAWLNMCLTKASFSGLKATFIANLLCQLLWKIVTTTNCIVKNHLNQVNTQTY